MSVHPFEDALNRWGPVRREIALESLQAQLEFLEAARRRHLLWARSAKDDELRQAHLEIVNLMERTLEQYCHLLDRYHKLA